MKRQFTIDERPAKKVAHPRVHALETGTVYQAASVDKMGQERTKVPAVSGSSTLPANIVLRSPCMPI